MPSRLLATAGLEGLNARRPARPGRAHMHALTRGRLPMSVLVSLLTAATLVAIPASAGAEPAY